ncbi:2-succinyl-5-enolpyruvyl-6-hydroxy-3-cyclohexene-1-carboxylic-acid synthase [Fructilactobacillus sp. Tb1]|uniref:2-succinyl-5-enolpyruvyl-6-hydroxy-3- cyclohexene-1-carboxylic-acid synthase n=1 Tax=Fructilactobacillus sp. Tb1 TaxID=3422304 RepID=UPI003D2E5F94
MNEPLTNNLKHLILALEAQGVEHFVISPGSRNTPLVLLLAEHHVKFTMAVDERSAAFLGLGIAKNTNQPVALVATSGTATANYLPAIAEAKSYHVPLIVLTTDRPQELQAIGAPQTIGQFNMYGNEVKEAINLEVQDQHADVTEYIDYKVQQLTHLSQTAPFGAVQINLPLRKPLVPELGLAWPSVSHQDFGKLIVKLDTPSLDKLVQQLQNKKIMIAVGPTDLALSSVAFENLADKLHAPIIADVLSNLRNTHHTIVGMDALLAAAAVNDEMLPDVVLRFGGTPVSAKLFPWLKEHNIPVIQIGMNYIGQDHTRSVSASYAVDENQLVKQLLDTDGNGNVNYWQQIWHPIQAKLSNFSDNALTSLSLADELANLPTDNQLFLANSMTVRDFDQYFNPKHSLKILGNRGANGIDGTISTATGMAINQKPTWLVIGDLAFYHDMNGLMLASQTHANLTIIVTNNDGGGIFSFLPQADKPYFEEMFGTPQHLAIDKVAALYDAEYVKLTSVAELHKIVMTPFSGLRILEITDTRDHNVTIHNQRLNEIKKSMTHEN